MNNNIITLIYSNNKTDRHDITNILLKVALNTINLNLIQSQRLYMFDVYRQHR
jgi:hypothetical protein